MARSLKQRYQSRKKVDLIRERVKGIDKQLLVEQRAADLIVEAMNQQDLDKVSAIIEKLTGMKSAGIEVLNKAIDAAIADVNKFTGGGPLTQAWSKMKQLVGIENPVVKVTTFANALEKGLGQIPQILKNNGIDVAALKKASVGDSQMTLADAIKKMQAPKTGTSDRDLGSSKEIPTQTQGLQNEDAKSDAEREKEKRAALDKLDMKDTHSGSALDKLDAKHNETKPERKASTPSMDAVNKAAKGAGINDPDSTSKSATQQEPAPADKKKDPTKIEGTLKNIVDQITKALAPGGIFGAFKKIPYIDGAELAQGLVNSRISAFAGLVKAANAGPKTSEVAADLKASMQGQQKVAGKDEPAASGSEQPATPPAETSGTSGTTATGNVPQPANKRGGGEPVKGKGVSDDAVRMIARDAHEKLKLKNYDDVERVVRYLRKIGKLQEAMDSGIIDFMFDKEKLRALVKG